MDRGESMAEAASVWYITCYPRNADGDQSLRQAGSSLYSPRTRGRPSAVLSVEDKAGSGDHPLPSPFPPSHSLLVVTGDACTSRPAWDRF